jgi:hypothetical protein
MTGILKVDQIQNNTGTVAMTIDTAGRILTPNRPSFFATKDNGSVTVNNSVIIFNNVRHNIGSHYNNSTGVFSAPIDGTYLFNFCLISGSTSLVEGEIQINGNRILNQRNYSGSSGTQNGIGAGMVFQLSANDSVRVMLLGSSSIYGAGDGYYDTFSGCLIG